MAITKNFFDKTLDGQDVFIYEISGKNGCTVGILNYGGTINYIRVPDKNGVIEDVALAFENMHGYENQTAYLGALIGRCGNRIDKGRFELNGKTTQLYCNDGANHLHGGKIGFDKKLWTVTPESENVLKLELTSPDGDENYDGNLLVTVRYTLTDENALVIEYDAVSDKDTVVNLTNHCYFNLSGGCSGTILGHKLQINADSFTANNVECIPTGEILAVESTPFDFRTLKTVGQDIEADDIQIKNGLGYDHNFIINKSDNGLNTVAEVVDEVSGRKMDVFSTEEGVQFYSGNFLDGTIIGRGGIALNKRFGLCLETQHFPNAINLKNFPTPVLKAGERYYQKTIYRFGIVK